MPTGKTTDLYLIRHAPVAGDGRVYGRRDLPAVLDDPTAIAALARAIPARARIVSSPARRCRQTAHALRPGKTPQTDPALWEQDFGAWEGVAHGDLPDLGPLDTVALAAHRPPKGESFDDLCARTAPALAGLAALGTDVLVVCHAGTIRAALAWAMGANAPALSFDIAPLSLTRITALSGGGAVIREVNRCPA